MNVLAILKGAMEARRLKQAAPILSRHHRQSERERVKATARALRSELGLPPSKALSR